MTPHDNEKDRLVYIQSFFVGDIIINSEIFVGADVLDRMDAQRTDVGIAVGFAVLGGPLLSHLTQVLLSIAHISPVFVFKATHYEHYFGSSAVLYTQLVSKLAKQALLQVSYKVFGSLELLGNPLSLLEDLNSGVSDFVSLTAEEVTGRKNFRGAGVQSLALSVVGGSFGVFSRQLKSLAEVVRSAADVGASTSIRRHGAAPRTISTIWQQNLTLGYHAFAVQPYIDFRRRGAASGIVSLGKGGLQVGALSLAGMLDSASVLAGSVHQLHKKGSYGGGEVVTVRHRVLGGRALDVEGHLQRQQQRDENDERTDCYA